MHFGRRNYGNYQTERTVEIGECLIKDWQNAGLLKPSAIKPAISTIEQKLILKKLGNLSSEDLAYLWKMP